jgi:hypothetical protein
MRLSGALVLTAALFMVASLSAARSPLPRERAEIARAVRIQVERDSPTVMIRANRVIVSTKLPGSRSIYSRFAAVSATGRDRAGRLVGSPLDALVAYSRRFQVWVVISYGSSEVGCREPQLFFGGRRAQILRDLNLSCP